MNKPSSAITILIVEDNLVDKQIFEAMFSEYRLFNEIIWAKDGDDAMRLIRAQHPKLVLLDTLLPGKDGFEVLEEIKNDVSLDDIQVVMVSGSTDLSTVKSMAPKADAFISKPITLECLASIVSQIDRFALGIIQSTLR
ncbi:MAG: response regulator [Methanomassiliicoccus sp.]|nr:response regulator [Methanomassiliicoccus sp.]